MRGRAHISSKEFPMSLMDILSPYANRPTSTEDDFDEVAKQLPPEVVGDGIAQAFRSDKTPAFGEMVSRMFSGSNPSVPAGQLNQLIAAVGPAIAGKLGSVLGNRTAEAPASISEADAQRLSPDQVSDIAEQAQKADPGVMDQIGNFYAKHPEVVKILGGAALAIALGRMANRAPR
jgi:hypothetical protein